MPLKRNKRCRHLGGTVLDHECEKGIDINALAVACGGQGHFTINMVPCWGKLEGGCEHYSAYTEDEWKQFDRESEELFNRTIKARTAIVDFLELGGVAKGEDANGVIDCPVCGGKLGFSRAGCNGHIWARCSTDNCVAWME